MVGCSGTLTGLVLVALMKVIILQCDIAIFIWKEAHVSVKKLCEKSLGCLIKK